MVRSRMLAAFLAGAAFLAALPFLAPPVVLQWEGVPPFLRDWRRRWRRGRCGWSPETVELGARCS